MERDAWQQIAIIAFTIWWIYCGYWAYGWAFGARQQYWKECARSDLAEDHKWGLFAAAFGPLGWVLAYANACDLQRIIYNRHWHKDRPTLHPQWEYIDWDPQPTIEELQEMEVEGW